MKRFYFVGGPKAGRTEEFFRRLAQIGGIPQGWSIFPHASGDGRALHLIETESPAGIHDHLEQLADLYEWNEIVEIREGEQAR